MIQPTKQELAKCPLVDYPEFAIHDVSTKPTFSEGARRYHMMNICGEEYTYLPLDDMLVRNDVLRWIERERKAISKQENDDLQIELL